MAAGDAQQAKRAFVNRMGVFEFDKHGTKPSGHVKNYAAQLAHRNRLPNIKHVLVPASKLCIEFVDLSSFAIRIYIELTTLCTDGGWREGAGQEGVGCFRIRQARRKAKRTCQKLRTPGHIVLTTHSQ